jgi:hypothetical protein
MYFYARFEVLTAVFHEDASPLGCYTMVNSYRCLHLSVGKDLSVDPA